LWLGGFCEVAGASDIPVIARRVVKVIHPEGYEPFHARLTAELRIAGFHVVAPSLSRLPSDSDIETELRTSSSFIFIRDLTRVVEIYYRTAEGQTFHLQVPLPLNSEEEQVTAIHIAEVLRVAIPRPAPVSTLPHTPPPPRAIRPVDRLTAHLTGATVFGDVAGPPQIAIHPSMGVALREWLAVGLIATIPLRAMMFHEAEGTIGIHAGALGAAVTVMPPEWPVRPFLRLGYQAWFFHASVQADEGFFDHPGTAFTSGPTGATGLVIPLRKRLGIELGVAATTTISALRYEVDGRTIAVAGRPILDAFAGVALLPGRLP
jgi:hypothetical protein